MGIKMLFKRIWNRAGRKAPWILLGLVVGVSSFYQTVQSSLQENGVAASQDQVRIDLRGPSTPVADAPPPGGDGKFLRVAVAPILSPEKSVVLYRPFVKYLASRIGLQPRMSEQQTYAQTNDMVHYGKCDLAVVCDYPFVHGEREFGMEALVIPQIRGAITYRSLILVPASSQARSLLDLKGKRFAVVDMLSNSGWLFPAVWLKRRGKDPVSFFSHMVFSGSHDQSLKAVLEGYVDGAAVNSLVYDQMVEEDPSVASKIRVVLVSPPYGMPPYVVSKTTDILLKKKLLKALLGMHLDPEGKKVLEKLGIQRFRVPDPKSFDSVRANARFWEGTL
jgi:phosphonate transport system substrate-binding protein